MKSFDPNFPIGANLILGLEGPTLTEREKLLLSIIRPTGIIFFKRNFTENETWRGDFAALVTAIKEITEGYTRIFSVDYEGGRVHRFPIGAPIFPYAQDWAKDSYKIGLEMAQFLKSININLSYAPCVDVDLESTNPVIGKRAFSSDPVKVTESSRNLYHAFEESNIISCAKHFPGHGRTKLDSHFELPILDITRVELNTDLMPYLSLIKERVPMIMSSHIIFQQIDPSFPASLSTKILTDLLREELQFTGLICSDDFDMKALNNIPKSDRLLQMINAGTDLVVMGNGMDGKAIEDAYEILSELSAKNLFLKNSLEKTGARLQELLIRYNLV